MPFKVLLIIRLQKEYVHTQKSLDSKIMGMITFIYRSESYIFLNNNN